MSRLLWPRAWVIWLVSTAASFALLEWAAYSKRKHRTLSRCLADWLGVEPRRPWWRIGLLAFMGAWTALTVHVARIRAAESS